jgi:3'(2'), 5'-bisphosphate nucleotidase
MVNVPEILQQVLSVCHTAGQAILEVYASDFEVDVKTDQSPLTEADRRAHDLIVAGLAKIDSSLPVLSEESPPSVLTERFQWQRFWLVDPLDGTREFVKRNGEFTVNIALVENHRTTLGVVHAPVLGTNYLGQLGVGAWTSGPDQAETPIRVTTPARSEPVVVGSRSHRGKSLDQILERLGNHQLVAMGSSLKMCLIATGEADFYPRLGPTSEWDTAAAQAVLESAGGYMIDLNGNPLSYNKADILNPHFLAFGDSDVNWRALLD